MGYPQKILENWQRFFSGQDNCYIKLSPSKTVICPKSTIALGCVWSERRFGQLALSCIKKPINTVCGLRSIINAFKVLNKVVPQYSSYLALLDDLAAGH
jgi:hypothetical protein